LFVLAKGSWNGVTVLNNTSYIDKMSKSSQSLNPSYGYLWWLNGKGQYMLPGSQFVFNGPLIPTAPPDMFSALGKNDQKIHIVPSLNIVVIRMGDAAGDGSSNVPIVFDFQLWEKLNKIMRIGTAVNDMANPVIKEKIAYCIGHKIFIKETIDVVETEVMDYNGKQVLNSGNEHQINVSNLNKGVYFVRVRNKKGSYYINKVFVN
jgi:CubicO group peptidase (beta-lactamase class C family)